VAAGQVSIELTSAQIDRIIRQASGAGNMSVLLSGLQGAGGTIQDNQRLLEEPRMSRSLLQGLVVLSGFPADGNEIGVIDLAHKIGLGDSTTYRYVATLLSVGLIERDPSTRRYRLAR
jgi:DNA-binding MarR family transcriptional regulator